MNKLKKKLSKPSPSQECNDECISNGMQETMLLFDAAFIKNKSPNH